MYGTSPVSKSQADKNNGLREYDTPFTTLWANPAKRSADQINVSFLQ